MPLPQLAPPLQLSGPRHIKFRGRRLLYFGGCDYFRLSSSPRVVSALRKGLNRFGLSVSASRMTTGNHPLYVKLEKQLAQFFQVQSATLSPNGWSANLMAAQALAGEFSRAFVDSRSHPSILDAAQYLNCPVTKFLHRDPADLQRKLRASRGSRFIILTDGLFAHSGALAPLDQYAAILPSRSLLLIDEAHSAGVLGPHGRGAAELLGIPLRKCIQTITLSKAFGVFGGAVLGPRKLRTQILSRSPLFTGSTPLPLPLAAAALESISILKANPALRTRLCSNLAFLRNALDLGDCPQHPGPILAFTPASSAEVAEVRKHLLRAGIFPTFIRYPGGAKSGFYRFAISSGHRRGDLLKFARAMQPFAKGNWSPADLAEPNSLA